MKGFLTVLCLAAIFSAVYAAAVQSEEYCNMGCKHIGCHHSHKFAPNCHNAKEVKITESLKKTILDAHNKKRNFIAGGNDAKHSRACRMATMKWDDELADLAALNVKQCQMRHDHCHNTKKFKGSGQNLYYKGTTRGDFDDAETLEGAIESWYGEVKYSNQNIIDSYPDNRPRDAPVIGHFTVMVADHNTHVGCAAATYTEGKFIIYLVACNYATTNWIGSPIYEKCSKAGQNCSTGTNSFFTNLCSENEQYNVNRYSY